MYSAKFYQGILHLNDLDEIIIEYKPDGHYTDFCNEHKGQLVTVELPKEIEDEKIYNLIAILSKITETNVAVAMPYDFVYSKKEIFESFKKYKLSYYFIDVIKDFYTLNQVFINGASAAIIGGDLAFDIIKARNIADKYNAKLKMLTSEVIDGNIYESFIRPEDLEVYEEYVDYFILPSIGRMLNIITDTMYEIYAKDKKWFGNLQEIFDLKEKLDSRCIPNVFGIKRRECGRHCMKGQGCNICNRVAELAKTLEEKDLMLIKLEI